MKKTNKEKMYKNVFFNERGYVDFEILLHFILIFFIIFIAFVYWAYNDMVEEAEIRALREFYGPEILADVQHEDRRGMNWNKKVVFPDGSVAYAKVVCETNVFKEIFLKDTICFVEELHRTKSSSLIQ